MTSWSEDCENCNTSPASSWRLRPRVSRGAAISCIPFPRGSIRALRPPRPLCHHRFLSPLLLTTSFHPSSSFTSFSSSSLRFSKEERRKFEMTADNDRKDGSGEITIESRVERERGVRGGKNCIRVRITSANAIGP